MSEIEEYQRRINAALDRIGRGLEASAGSGDGARIEALEQQLEDERLANAQLEERVRTLKEARDAARAELEAARAEAEAARTEAGGRLAKLDGELQSLRKANQQLRDNNAALREANAQGVGQPHLINKSMLAELEALRASHAADRAEAETILAELDRILDGDAAGDDATQSEDA